MSGAGLDRVTGALCALDRALTRLVLVLAAALLCLAASVAMWQVVTRFVFEDPSTWSEVICRALIVWMVYLGLALALRAGALMSVEYLFARSRGRGRALLVCLIAGVSLAALLIMLWYGQDMAYRVRFQTIAGVLNPFTGKPVSISWLYASVPVGAALGILAVAARTAEQLGRRREDNERAGAGTVLVE